ncbi:MAG TPA: molybdopterin-dependent oxidoreductase, partial [Solimonas sp.]
MNTNTNTRRHTFCRICEPHCPLQAEIDADGQVIQLHPDPGHPSGGTPCHKGLSFLKVHRDPDRLNWPLHRANPRSEARGQFEPTTWEHALGDIGARIKALSEKHGPDSVAVYFGNPSVFNAGGLMMTSVFLETLGTRMRFSAATLDASNKFAGAGAIYGSAGAFMAPDIYHTHYLLVLGSNP